MSVAYWQAKIWGILHDPLYVPIIQALRDNKFLEGLGLTEESQEKFEDNIKLASGITSASDHSAVKGIENTQINDLKISHLLSGDKLPLEFSQAEKAQYLQEQAKTIVKDLVISIDNNDSEIERVKRLKKFFWWLWRCLPQATINALGNEQKLLLIPADAKFPDSSVWSNASLIAAITGALVGYDEGKDLSHPYLASFTFSPIQELIKASRKMRDLWAGSWLLHYLSAKVSWQLAKKYGPDCLLYPNLYQQPFIDKWLLEEYTDFNTWIKSPSSRALLTAGFPNVIVIILPEKKVAGAMDAAKQELLNAWKEIGSKVFEHLQTEKHWTRELKESDRSWQGWLESQWQTYWSAVPIGKKSEPLKVEEINEDWINTQNIAYDLAGEKALFSIKEKAFFEKVGDNNLNIGSWWANIFDQTRLAVATVKNAKAWQLPTAFGPRSTVSGLGPVVYDSKGNKENWAKEGDTGKYWVRHAGLFDGIEQLNATETLKRGLHKVLPKLLNLDEDKINASYPDLTVGIAGYLKNGSDKDREYFKTVCQKITTEVLKKYNKIPDSIIQSWGIPYVDEDHQELKQYHPRLLNAGWLIEELEISKKDTNQEDTDQEDKEELLKRKRERSKELQDIIDGQYPNNNPTDWYVLAVGDGDGMSDWLKGTKMKPYSDYISSELVASAEGKFKEFLTLTKRMGPSTHNALSRALLDFSNQLVPYLTETRYAGRLIYGGGDDVLAYTNLWEWDNWLWDIRQCFKGDKDPQKEFDDTGDYWKWQGEKQPPNLAKRPLFTMGNQATISFGVVIVHHSVPLAIALESLREAEGEAKKHEAPDKWQIEGQPEKDTSSKKDAVQVRVIYGNGNTLKTTTKFDVFHQWQELINLKSDPEDNTSEPALESSIFEQAALILQQHPIPYKEAIEPWVMAFCSRREQLKDKPIQERFQTKITSFIKSIWNVSDGEKTQKEADEKNKKTKVENFNQELQNWFKIAAFVLRTRKIKIGEVE